MSYVALPDVDMLHYQMGFYQVITFIDITTYIIRKFFYVLGCCQVHGVGYKCYKILIFAWKLESISNKYCQLFFLKWWAYLVHFWENVGHTRKSEQLPSVVLVRKWHSIQKAVSSALNSNNGTSTFPWRSTSFFGTEQKRSVLYVYFPFCQKDLYSRVKI